jgi:uncharacterized protein (DUF486 family)
VILTAASTTVLNMWLARQVAKARRLFKVEVICVVIFGFFSLFFVREATNV